MVDIDIDIDIWGYGRDAAAAGRFTTTALKASYPFVEFKSILEVDAMCRELDKTLERNGFDQRMFMTHGRFLFFQSREDADLCRGLQYLI